jgi:hypothetical protein
LTEELKSTPLLWQRRQRLFDLVHEVHHHDVLGRDAAVGLEIEAPKALLVLRPHQRLGCFADRGVERAGLDPRSARRVRVRWRRQRRSRGERRRSS